MTYKKILERLDRLYPNEYSKTEKLLWIDDVNADVVKNIEKRTDEPPAAIEEDAAIVPKPYDDIYIFYILAQIAYYQRDSEAYARHMERYASGREDYMDYRIRTYGGETAKFANWLSEA